MESVEGILPLSREQGGSHRVPYARELKEKIRQRTAKVGVVGLGYVGLPLALEMARTGFEVTGIDLVRERVDSVNSGISYIQCVAVHYSSYQAGDARGFSHACLWLGLKLIICWRRDQVGCDGSGCQ